jgi:hypothetical protein
MTFHQQRAADLAYTRLVAAELRLRFFLARLRLQLDTHS